MGVSNMSSLERRRETPRTVWAILRWLLVIASIVATFWGIAHGIGAGPI
jgi:hypothetical protein